MEINDATVGWRGCGHCGYFYYGKHSKCPHRGQKKGAYNSGLILWDKLIKIADGVKEHER